MENAIRAEYITTDISYRALAEKYGISKSTLHQLGNKEDWAAQRKAYRDSLRTPMEDPQAQLRHTAQQLLRKIEIAVSQLDIRQSVTVRKEKEVFYENQDRRDKATREVVTESESAVTVSCPVDRQGIQTLAKALRDVEELLSEAEDTSDARQITVRLEGCTEEYAG